MDTLTHALVGISLTGLAFGNPEIAQNPEAQQAIFIATFIGSQGPDFDIIYRCKSKVSYYQHHRGLSHSILTLGIMSLITSLLLNQLIPEAQLPTILFWTLLAAFLHVGMDLLTPYNLNLFKPINEKTFSWNIMFIIDPFVLSILGIGIVLWLLTPLHPFDIFSFAFIVIGLYLLLRTVIYAYLLNYLRKKIVALKPGFKRFTLMPCFLPTKWDLTLENEKQITTGQISILPIEISFDKTFSKHSGRNASKLINRTYQMPEIQAFLKEAKHLHIETEELSNGYLVKWIDLGHRFRNRYPYTAFIILNYNLEILYADFGWRSKKIPSWLYQEGYLTKKF